MSKLVIDCPPKHLMVFRTGHLGDTICAIPAFRMIRRELPSARLSLLCDRPKDGKVAMQDILESMEIFDEIFTYTSNKDFRSLVAFMRTVRRARPDAMLLLPQARESAKSIRRKGLLVRSLGIHRVYFDLPTSGEADWVVNEPWRLDTQLRAMGFRGSKPAYDIPIHESARLSVQRKLSAEGVDIGKPFLVFCPGGKAATQHWPLDRYAMVLGKIHADFQIPIVLLGTVKETDSFLTTSPELPVVRIVTSLVEMFELLRNALVYFGNDTGPMHVAAAVKCPVCVVMSARNRPGAWDPDVMPSLAIRERTSCENCFLSDCIVEKHRCMTGISGERVLDQFSAFLRNILASRATDGVHRP